MQLGNLFSEKSGPPTEQRSCLFLSNCHGRDLCFIFLGSWSKSTIVRRHAIITSNRPRVRRDLTRRIRQTLSKHTLDNGVWVRLICVTQADLAKGHCVGCVTPSVRERATPVSGSPVKALELVGTVHTRAALVGAGDLDRHLAVARSSEGVPVGDTGVKAAVGGCDRDGVSGAHDLGLGNCSEAQGGNESYGLHF